MKDVPPQAIELIPQGLGLLVETLVDMTQWPLHGADRIDRSLNHAQSETTLEQHEGGADVADERRRITRDDPLRVDPDIVQTDGVGACALHAGKGRTGQQLNPRGGSG
jgi:hypothetical protein